jgi:BirA family transcriptional regulator, biotin operon repressor / biotin---[acetyl-CoA-carboxylase] ligase
VRSPIRHLRWICPCLSTLVDRPEAGSSSIPAHQWEGCTSGELATHWQLPRVLLFASVSSTNDIARRLAGTGAPSGTLVLADEQRAGRGRGARNWASPAGLGFWGSFVIRDISAETLATLPLRVAVAVARGLEVFAPQRIRIKWPNDLFSGGQKLGGILCEAAWDGNRLGYVIAGIGINVLQSVEDFPIELRKTATSLWLAAGERPLSRFEVASGLMKNLLPVVGARAPGPSQFDPQEFAVYDALVGKTIDVLEPETGRILLTGRAHGVSSEGALLVATEGRIVPVTSGTIRLSRAHG